MAASERGGPHTGALARGVALAALVAVVLWAMYLARNALLIIYISGLLAIGFRLVQELLDERDRLQDGNLIVADHARWHYF